MHAPTPVMIGRYPVLRELGRGASATVYLGYDEVHDRQVAIKQIHPHLLVDERQHTRYRRGLRNEALLAGQLRHPHIVRLFDADGEANPPYLVMEYVEGRPLSAFTQADSLLPVGQVLDLAFRCCDALDHAHSMGLVHRDIKPANLMLQDDGGLKVMDFGTAVSARSDATQLTGLVGSPAYMAPEQVREEGCTHQSDMFSLAVVVYQMLTGRLPFDGDSDFAILYKIGSEEPPRPSVLRSQLPREVDAVLARAMAKRPQDRWPDWRAFAEALLAINRGLEARLPEEREGERFQQLRALDFFAGFPDTALWECLRLGRLKAFDAGEVLMEEKTTGTSFYIILEGEIEVTRDGWHLASLQPGVTLGEMVYLQPDHPVRTATATAKSDALVLKIQSAALRAASENLQSLFDKAFIRLLVQRLIATSAQIVPWGINEKSSRRRG